MEASAAEPHPPHGRQAHTEGNSANRTESDRFIHHPVASGGDRARQPTPSAPLLGLFEVCWLTDHYQTDYVTVPELRESNYRFSAWPNWEDAPARPARRTRLGGSERELFRRRVDMWHRATCTALLFLLTAMEPRALVVCCLMLVVGLGTSFVVVVGVRRTKTPAQRCWWWRYLPVKQGPEIDRPRGWQTAKLALIGDPRQAMRYPCHVWLVRGDWWAQTGRRPGWVG